ncbi:hypothetical protein LTR86_003130 [Recurvomyces mirabilis]|nr:hypothetical protein LTR86_003130 [Recurvomyces mirabilis]
MPHSEHSDSESSDTPMDAFLTTTSETIYLVTGANRGLGLGFSCVLLSRPNTCLIAAVRDPSKAYDLWNLPKAEDSRLIIVKIDGNVDSDPQAAVDTLRQTYDINHLDVVIANAGIEQWFGPTTNIPLSELRTHFEINALSPLALFQATYPLLLASPTKSPKFVPISSRLGSMTEIAKVQNPAAAYGASKAMLNYLTCRMHHESEESGLVAFPMSPGFVQTDMGNAGEEGGDEEGGVYG